MKHKILTTAAFLCAFTLTSGCGSYDDAASGNTSSIETTSSTDSSHASLTDTSETSSSKSSEIIPESSEVNSKSNDESSTISFDDLPDAFKVMTQTPAEERPQSTSDGKPIVYFHKETDNSIMSDDGLITQSFEYIINEDKSQVDITYVTTNNSDQTVTLADDPAFFLVTDLSDFNTVFNSTLEGGIKNSITLSPGETKEQTIHKPLDKGWSIAKLSIVLSPSSIDNKNTEIVYKGGDYFIIELTK